MAPIEEIHRVTPGLAVWQAFDASVKTDLSCSAVKTPEGWVLIDPLPLATNRFNELEQEAAIAAIVLTNGNHERAADSFRTLLGVPLFAGTDAEIQIAVDERIAEGDTVAGSLAVIALPGAGSGEIALWSPDAGGILCLGDTLVHLESTGFTFLPDKYCLDPGQAKESLRKLKPLNFEIMTFAHGMPLVQNARNRLLSLLEKYGI